MEYSKTVIVLRKIFYEHQHGQIGRSLSSHVGLLFMRLSGAKMRQ